MARTRSQIRPADAQLGASSDDDDYQGVDSISESGEDEPDVEQVEEKFIIDSEEENDVNGASTLRVASSKKSNQTKESKDGDSDCGSVSSTGEWDGLELDDGMLPDVDEDFGPTDSFMASEIEVLNAVNAFDRHGSERPSTHKRVRFDDDEDEMTLGAMSRSLVARRWSRASHDSSDVFVPRSRLAPEFRRLIDDEHEHSQAQMPSATWADPSGDAFSAIDDAEDSSAFSTLESSSSGYETDDGDTTDEDLPPPPTIARTRSVLRSLSRSSSADDDSDRPSPPRRSSRSGPSLGSWVADPTKPIAVLDSTGKRLVIYPAQRPARPLHHDTSLFSAVSSCMSSPVNASPRTPLANLIDDSDDSNANTHNGYSMNDRRSGIGHAGTNLMMSGLWHVIPGTEQTSAGSHIYGPPEAFFPYGDPDSGLADIHEEGGGNGEDGNEDEGEAKLRFHDFLDFGDVSSDDEDTQTPSKAMNSPNISAITTTSSANHTKRGLKAKSIHGRHHASPSQRLVEHFDRRGVVTSWRRNQARSRHRFGQRVGMKDSNLPFSRPFDKAMFRAAAARGGAASGRFSVGHATAITPITNASTLARKRKYNSTTANTSTTTTTTGPLFGYDRMVKRQRM